MKPEVGQWWREMDGRENNSRVVEVLEIWENAGKVKILTVDTGDPCGMPKTGARATWANIGRFHGKAGGYALHERHLPPVSVPHEQPEPSVA